MIGSARYRVVPRTFRMRSDEVPLGRGELQGNTRRAYNPATISEAAREIFCKRRSALAARFNLKF